MDLIVPSGARAAARVLLVSERNRLLLLQAEDSLGGHRWWVAPGGGLRAGEGFEAAAQRELEEETGLLLPIGPWVWTRRHVFTWGGRRHDQYERYFVARAEEGPLAPTTPDGYVVGHRWWGLSELEQSDEDFAPRRLARLLPPILRGEYPDAAIDCGV
jgi:8-oxo-dGTP pyrophosphatase MutT (NUDIX family)